MYYSDKLWIRIFICLAIIFSCGGKNRISDQIFQQVQHSTIVFAGTLNCDTCISKQMIIRLSGDTTWQADLIPVGLSGESAYMQGTYMIRNKSLILLTDDTGIFPQRFTFNGDSLIPEGMENSSLRLFQHSIIEVKWYLTEVKGKTIPGRIDGDRKPYFILKLNSDRISGHGGCNGFSGYYELSGQNKIRFSGIISTKMACIEIDFENDFFDVLHNTDNYIIQDKFLLLRKGDQVLAKFTSGK